jgi:pimeloyl-ACP methyl ester carboxylesterase
MRTLRSAPARRTRRWAATALAATLLAGGAGATRAEAQPVPHRFSDQSVAWATCPGATDPAHVCGDVTVPLDYAHPEDRTLDIAVSRFPATGSAPKLGSLLVNFGGPGLSGVRELANAANAGSGLTALNRRYDLIGFDPRGTGKSAPVDCGDLDGVTGPAQLARACAKRSGWLLPYLSTANTARDLDVVRQVLGDDRLTYLGFSYGSVLGAVYAHEFPTRVGRIALDGVPDPTLDDVGTALSQARAFQRALGRFAADCAAGDCPVPGRTGAQVVAGITAGVRHAGRTPLPTDQGDLDRDAYLRALLNALYSKDNWPYLRQALEDLRTGDGDLMMALAHPDTLGRAVRDWGADPEAGYRTAQLAIACRDTPERHTPAQLHALQGRFTTASPLFGRTIEATLLSCTGWPRGSAATRTVAAPTAPETLLVSTIGDPATPYEGARAMARALANDSRVLTYRGDGHGAYFAHDGCVSAAVNAYFLDGALPRAGAAC